MAISLRPISFQLSRTAADGLSAGFGGSFGLASDCAKAGTAARNTVKHSPARDFVRFIFLSSVAPGFKGSTSRAVWGCSQLRRPQGPDVSRVLASSVTASMLLAGSQLCTTKLACTQRV